MRVAIAGAGNVGLFIANDLRAAEHDVMIIEQSPAVVKRSQTADDGIQAGRLYFDMASLQRQLGSVA